VKERGEGIGAFTLYKADPGRFAAAARERMGNPVLVMSMYRKSPGPAGKIKNMLGDYPEAGRRVAREQKLALIDLHALSAQFHEALGPEKIGAAFQDATHRNNYGSYELAKCVVARISSAGIPLANHPAQDVPPFDPAHPDPVEGLRMAVSPRTGSLKPDGS